MTQKREQNVDQVLRDGKSSYEIIEDAGTVIGIVALAALSSPVSQLTLSPVYGSIPSSINHKAALTITFLSGFLLFNFLRRYKLSKVQLILPLIAAIIPLAEYFALLFSAQLGIVGGPILAGLISCHGIVIPSAYAIAELMDGLSIPILHDGIPPALMHASIALIPFTILERFFATQLPVVITNSKLITPVDVQLIVSAALALLTGPGPALTVLTWSLLIATYLFNPHGNGPYAFNILNRGLEKQDWTLLERQWSTTGYLSVLESHQQHYRILRCDHSILGGEWLLNDERRSQGWTGNEPTYSVFSMLEAVRLMQTDTPIADSDARALVIGAGIGTAPKALLQHGIDTTIVELDAGVHDYAVRCFGLPTNHTAILRDATTWIREEAARDDYQRLSFDYIIHDVFTGGAEPLSLFTTRFLQDLRTLLKTDGVAAINYAGDLNMPLTVKVLNTIDLMFDRQCEVYSDDAARKDGSVESFSNFIVFCRNSPGTVAFRQATSADFLGSVSKQNYLSPRAEQRLTKSWSTSEEVLEAGHVGSWRKAQEESAIKHWQIMRTVLPAQVWEMY